MGMQPFNRVSKINKWSGVQQEILDYDLNKQTEVLSLKNLQINLN